MNTFLTNVARTFALMLFALGALVLQGCMSQAPTGLVSITHEGDQVLGIPAVDVDNHRGSVTVIVNPALTEPQVTAVARGSMMGKETPQWTAATMANDSGRPVLRVLSGNSASGGEAPIVDIIVRVPACGGVRIHNDGGQVILTGVQGAIEVENSMSGRDAAAIVLTTQQRLNDPVTLHTDKGDITVRMPRDSAGKINASAPQGSVNVDARAGSLQDVHMAHQAWMGTLNSGRSDLKFGTEAGNIWVTLTQ